jgi:hypothetical protein
MDLLMSFSVDCPLKLLPTHITGIGLAVFVGFHVAGEVSFLAERFSADFD